jgi:hypothetical protein
MLPRSNCSAKNIKQTQVQILLSIYANNQYFVLDVVIGFVSHLPDNFSLFFRLPHKIRVISVLALITIDWLVEFCFKSSTTKGSAFWLELSLTSIGTAVIRFGNVRNDGYGCHCGRRRSGHTGPVTWGSSMSETREEIMILKQQQKIYRHNSCSQCMV